MICCFRTRSGSYRTTRLCKPERAMAPEIVLAWQKLYSAVALLAAICSACALLKTCYDVRTGALAPPQRSVAGWILWLPRVWLHFQLAYFLGFPSILAIAVLYAHYIGFEAFIPS